MASSVSSPPERWDLLDSLRGFALLGILLVNSIDITHLSSTYLLTGGETFDDPVRDTLYLTVSTRFVPIFAFLFGMSLFFMLTAARARHRSPWLILVRRLVVLAGFGVALAVVYPGNILLDYALFGLLILPLVLFVPAAFITALGAALTIGAYAAFGGGEPTTPGLLLVGAGCAGLGVPQILQAGRWPVALSFVLATGAAVPALAWQLTEPGDPRFTVGGIAGLILAAAYVCGFALLWRTPARKVLRVVFDPLGRMALTNYATAATVFAVLAAVIDFGHMTTAGPVVLLSVVVIATQSALSHAWLHHFTYGPLEWAWRCATWWRLVPLRRTPTGAAITVT